MTLFQRYILNGLAATAVHYAVLVVNMDLLQMPSAGLANALAAIFGISASFLGNRIFVFRASDAPMPTQAFRFFALYAVIALVHGAILLLWSDIAGYSYSTGFVIATVVQFMLSFMGNKNLVFRR